MGKRTETFTKDSLLFGCVQVTRVTSGTGAGYSCITGLLGGGSAPVIEE